MKFIEIINKCLAELNYRKVKSWAELTLNDHQRLKDIISRLNHTICSAESYPFLDRVYTTRLLPNQTQIANPVNGRILAINIDGERLSYTRDFNHATAEKPARTISGYSSHAGELILPRFDRFCELRIFYNTNYSAIGANLDEKEFLELEDDESLLPEAFANSLLLYGACMQFKANPEHPRFKYWYSMYTDALGTMRSKCLNIEDNSPNVRLFRH